MSHFKPFWAASLLSSLVLFSASAAWGDTLVDPARASCELTRLDVMGKATQSGGASAQVLVDDRVVAVKTDPATGWDAERAHYECQAAIGKAEWLKKPLVLPAKGSLQVKDLPQDEPLELPADRVSCDLDHLEVVGKVLQGGSSAATIRVDNHLVGFTYAPGSSANAETSYQECQAVVGLARHLRKPLQLFRGGRLEVKNLREDEAIDLPANAVSCELSSLNMVGKFLGSGGAASKVVVNGQVVQATTDPLLGLDAEKAYRDCQAKVGSVRASGGAARLQLRDSKLVVTSGVASQGVENFDGSLKQNTGTPSRAPAVDPGSIRDVGSANLGSR